MKSNRFQKKGIKVKLNDEDFFRIDKKFNLKKILMFLVGGLKRCR